MPLKCFPRNGTVQVTVPPHSHNTSHSRLMKYVCSPFCVSLTLIYPPLVLHPGVQMYLEDSSQILTPLFYLSPPWPGDAGKVKGEQNKQLSQGIWRPLEHGQREPLLPWRLIKGRKYHYWSSVRAGTGRNTSPAFWTIVYRRTLLMAENVPHQEVPDNKYPHLWLLKAPQGLNPSRNHRESVQMGQARVGEPARSPWM